MKRKGFTLIEVLAVIVILAIIALIATPIMLGVIENARRKAFEDTGYGVIEGVRAYYVEKLSEEGVVGEKIFTFPNSELKLSGTEPAGGNAKLYADGSIELAIHNNRWCATKTVNEDEVTTVDYVEGECKIPEPDSILMNDFMSRGNVTTNKTKITSIEFVGTKEVPIDALDSWDASEENNGSVMAWLYEDEENEGYYKLYIGGNGRVYAPEDSSYLFGNFGNIQEIDVELLDTSKVTDMSDMFIRCRNLITIDVSNFNTSNVTDMSCMFYSCTRLTTIDISHFETSNVTNAEDMFCDCSSLEETPNADNFSEELRSVMFSCNRPT